MQEIFCGNKVYVPSKIICVGKNFADHAREMGDASPPQEPVIFIKPNSSISFAPEVVSIPETLGLLHHEVELCALLGRGGGNLGADEAQDAIAGYGVGVDFTLRDLQTEAKKKGWPWSLSKGFDSACVLGKFRSSSEIDDADGLPIGLSVNATPRQEGNTEDMIFSPSDIIRFVSQFMTLERGDVLMCGTPAGVGEVKDGDRIDAIVEGLPELSFVVRRK